MCIRFFSAEGVFEETLKIRILLYECNGLINIVFLQTVYLQNKVNSTIIVGYLRSHFKTSLIDLRVLLAMFYDYSLFFYLIILEGRNWNDYIYDYLILTY